MVVFNFDDFVVQRETGSDDDAPPLTREEIAQYTQRILEEKGSINKATKTLLEALGLWVDKKVFSKIKNPKTCSVNFH